MKSEKKKTNHFRGFASAKNRLLLLVSSIYVLGGILNNFQTIYIVTEIVLMIVLFKEDCFARWIVNGTKERKERAKNGNKNKK